MDPAEWRQIKAIFHEASELPAGGRAAYLDQACANNHEIRRAVESLLANDQAASDFMERAAPGRTAPTVLEAIPARGSSGKRATFEIGVGVTAPPGALELPPLLRKRLISLTLIELIAFGAFYAGRFLRVDFTPRSIWGMMVPGALYLAFMAVMAGALWRTRPSVLRRLRVFEAAIFTVTTVFYINENYAVLFGDPPWLTLYAERHPAEMSILARQSAILWLTIIVAYGTFIPNTGRRCALVTSLIASGPLATVAIAGRLHHSDARSLTLYLVEMTFWMVAAVAMAVYGSQKLTALREEALAARKLGQYQLKRRLGRGGMGEVFLAEHVLLKRPCAVKIIRPEQAGDSRTVQRFLREVTAAATLTHPNTIQVFDYGQSNDGTVFYAMEYLVGFNLQEVVESEGPMPAGRVAFVLRQLCGALGEAHAIGLIHRDLKPSNVILTSRAGVHDVAKLLDFGLVHTPSLDTDTRLTQAGLVFGTPDYMSPEQAAGRTDVDARSDIYSVGALACFLLTGRPPFERPSTAQVLAAHIEDPAGSLRARVADLPQDLDLVVLRCLQKHPDARYSTMAALEAALGACGSAGEWTQADAAAWWTASGRLADRTGPSIADTRQVAAG